MNNSTFEFIPLNFWFARNPGSFYYCSTCNIYHEKNEYNIIDKYIIENNIIENNINNECLICMDDSNDKNIYEKYIKCKYNHIVHYKL